MPHEALRPYVDSADDLYTLLQADQMRAERRLRWQPWGLLALMVITMAFWGPVGKAALCIAVLLGFQMLQAQMELVCRNWFMHALTLLPLLRVRDAGAGWWEVIDAMEAHRALMERNDG